MNLKLISLLTAASVCLAVSPAQAWRGAGFGGFGGGGFAVRGPDGGGGFVARGPDGGVAGGYRAPDGAWHAGGVGAYGGTWHADGYHAGGWGVGYGYHGPAVVNSYYGGGCYACGAAAVGAAAAVAGAYAIGATLATLPPGCATQYVDGATYYVCNGSWLSPQYGNNGLYYTVVNPL